jgi:hypothetical protein
MFTYCNAVRRLTNSSYKEFNKNFTNNIAKDIWYEDSNECFGPCCCDMYDDDHLSDEYYEWEHEYMKNRNHLFYENIFKLKDIFTIDFLEKIKIEKNAEIDSLNVYLKVTSSDLLGGYTSKFFANFFDEGNKYNLELYATVYYKDFDLTKIRSVEISVMDPFSNMPDEINRSTHPMYRFNINYEKHTHIDFSKISFYYKKVNHKNIPDWCESMEEKGMYMFLDNPTYKKLKDVFDIKEVIKDLSVFEILKMYMF